METIFTAKKMSFYYQTPQSQLVLGDSFRILTKMQPESVDMIFADPPYFLSNNGVTCQNGKMVSVNKGAWDSLSEQGTSVADKHKFNRKWGVMILNYFWQLNGVIAAQPVVETLLTILCISMYIKDIHSLHPFTNF